MMKIAITIASALLICISTSSQTFSDKDVLLAIDIQEHFTKNTLDSTQSAQLIENANKVIKQFQPNNVIYIQSILSVLNLSFKGTSIDTLPNLEFDSRLKIVSKKIIQKDKVNSFTVPQLAKEIKALNAEHVVVIGLMAEHCVYKTLIGGQEVGFQMIALPQAIAAKSDKSKEKFLKKLKKKGIKTISDTL